MSRSLLAICATSLLLATGCAGAKPHVWVKQSRSLTACLSPGCGEYLVTLKWSGLTIAAQTGYYVFLNGSQVDDVAGQQYTFEGVECGTSYTLGVEAHHGSGNHGPLHTASWSSPACGGGGGAPPANISVPLMNGYVMPNSEVMANDAGSWANVPTSFRYQWQDCTASSGGPCSDASNTTGLSGERCSATAFCYVPSSSEIGDYLQVVVMADNAAGTGTATSARTQVASSMTVGTEPNGPGSCALTAAAGVDGQSNYSTGNTGDFNNESCWGEGTGITGGTGCTEAQLVSGESDASITNPCGSHYFTVVNGNQSYSTANAVVANKIINGCVAVQQAASSFHMRDVLIHSSNVGCQNTSSYPDAQSSNWQDGNQTGVPTNVVVEDFTEDALSVNLEVNPTNNSFGMIMGDGGTCLRCNIFGFAKGIQVDGLDATHVTTLQDSFVHDPPRPQERIL